MTVPRLVGSIDAASPTAASTELLVLLPSLGTSSSLWDGVVAKLQRARPGVRMLRIDLPGHGASPAASEPFTMTELAEGALRVIDAIGGGAFWVAGVSLGGAVGLELAFLAPDRVRGLALFSSGSRIGSPEGWAARQEQIRGSGTASVVTGSAERWFAPGFLASEGGAAGAAQLTKLVDVDDASYNLDVGALAAFDRTHELGRLTLPTVLVSAEYDTVTTPEQMRELAAALPGSRYVELAGASHLSVIERPDAASAALEGLLRVADGTSAAPDPAADAAPDDARTRGMATRRAVLGDAHVDRATASTTPETAPFQDFITRYAWGEIWSRPELGRRERSIATLAVLVADSHENELRMHIRAALRNGLTRVEIAEVIMHTALYAGLPPANGALASMREVFADLDADLDADSDAQS